MVFKLGLQFCQQPLAKELVTYKTLPSFWFAPETAPLILRESEWDLVERFTIQGVFEGGRWERGWSRYPGHHNSLSIGPYFLALLIASVGHELATIQMLIARGRSQNKILFPFSSVDVPGTSRQIDLCDSDAEISFKDTVCYVSTGFCCVNYMGVLQNKF